MVSAVLTAPGTLAAGAACAASAAGAAAAVLLSAGTAVSGAGIFSEADDGSGVTAAGTLASSVMGEMA